MIDDEVVMAYLKVLVWYSSEGNEETTVRIVGVMADSGMGHLPNTRHKHFCFSELIPSTCQ
jgi:hypothetical protein